MTKVIYLLIWSFGLALAFLAMKTLPRHTVPGCDSGVSSAKLVSITIEMSCWRWSLLFVFTLCYHLNNTMG
ncbi:uncharacterized protein V1513DRAFT_445632 [Lipomyces chichibuensis]|uniref:uncharacterized protein n=1 Tax=Lipomyces chichibuensis TaxID=1546026 RepID=UPI003343A4F1